MPHRLHQRDAVVVRTDSFSTRVKRTVSGDYASVFGLMAESRRGSGRKSEAPRRPARSCRSRSGHRCRRRARSAPSGRRGRGSPRDRGDGRVRVPDPEKGALSNMRVHIGGGRGLPITSMPRQATNRAATSRPRCETEGGITDEQPRPTMRCPPSRAGTVPHDARRRDGSGKTSSMGRWVRGHQNGIPKQDRPTFHLRCTAARGFGTAA